MHARINNVRRNNVPTNLSNVQSNENQKIVFKNNNVEIPIEFFGPIPYIPIRYPTDSEMDKFHWLSLTNPSKWIPYKSIKEVTRQKNRYQNPNMQKKEVGL